ncbi:MAG: hypothetical protein ND895_29085 [Pyrinomonadaceae bacterium]|nr:hypothetical protein [Pyrinomonadaceae bacterium]
MKNKRTLATILGFVALAALTTLGIVRGTRQVQAQDQAPPQHDRISFGMVGITPGQTLRVNVSNVIATNDSVLPPGPSRVAFIVINSHGDPIRHRDGSPVRRVVMLERGESAFLDLNGDDLQFPPGPSRLQVRAVVNVFAPGPTDNDVPPPTDGRIVPSVELFNNANGRTVVFIGNPGVIRGFNPQPDPPL